MSRFGFLKMIWEGYMDGFALTAVVVISTLCFAVSLAAFFCLRDVFGLLSEISETLEGEQVELASGDFSGTVQSNGKAGAEDEAEEKRRIDQKRWDEGIANLLSFDAGRGK